MKARCLLCRRRRGQAVQLGARDNVDLIGPLCPPCQVRLAEFLRALLGVAHLLRQLDRTAALRLLKTLLLLGRD